MPASPAADSKRSADTPNPGRAKRVALFTGAYNHIADGVSLTLNRLVRHLETEENVEVLVFAPTIDDPSVDHAGTLVPVPSISAPGRSEYRLSLGITPSVRRRLEDFSPDLFHIATPDLLGYHALRTAQSWGVPVVATYHTHFASYLRYYYLSWLEPLLWAYLRHFYRQCVHTYVPSTAMAEILREHGITEGLHLWQRGVELDRFTPERRSDAWRKQRGLDGAPVVAYVSRLVWEKAPDMFAEVIRRLEAEGIPHHSLIVGDGPARADLEEQLPNTVFTGYLEGTELATAYASADVFLFPSDTETFGNVTLEAMASGLPAVCARAVGSRDLVVDGETGYLCPPDDVDAFTQAVRHLITNHDARSDMSRAAIKRANEFRWEAILSKMDGLYEEALGDWESED
jgi:phosphatidylinositol alpha 1,6-mannosyltransferase